MSTRFVAFAHLFLLVVLFDTAGCREKPHATSSLPRSIREPLTEESVQQACAELQRLVEHIRRTSVLADVVFEECPAPTETPSEAIGVLYQGVQFVLPPDDYRCSVQYDPRHRTFRLSFLTSDGHGVIGIGPMEDSEPMPDVFAIVGGGFSDEAAQEFTKKVFGKPPTLFDIEEIGFSVPAKDFQCSQEQFYNAVRSAVALSLKALFPVREPLKACRGLGISRSHLITGLSGGGNHIVHYNLAFDRVFLSLQASLQEAVSFHRLVSLLSRVSPAPGQNFENRMLSPVCSMVLSFVQSPSPVAARDLLERIPDRPEHRVLRENLLRYLETEKRRP